MPTISDQRWKQLFWLCIALIALLMVIITPRYGVTGDEYTQWEYGKAVWGYFSSGGANKDAISGKFVEEKMLQYYGGLFDGLAAMMTALFKPKDQFLLRHYWNACFGLLALIMAGLLGRQVGGRWRTAVLVLLFLVLTPRFFGEMFNNPKDIPFAATYALGLYAIINWLKGRAQPSWKRTILLGLAIALGLSIRIGGLLLVAYLGLFWLIAVWRDKERRNVKAEILHLAVAVLIGYFGCMLAWPYALENPLTGPKTALDIMANYPLPVRMLYEGHMVRATELPTSYAIKMLGITLPLVLWMGFAAGLGLLFAGTIRRQYPYWWMVGFAAVFPVAYIMIQHSVLYDGIRHMLFVLPMMAVVAGVALDVLFARFSTGKPALRYGLIAVAAALFFLPLRFMVAAHPNQYVYFNETVGGLKGAYGSYETDYYMNSVKDAYRWLVASKKEEFNRPGDTLTVGTNALAPINYAYLPVSDTRMKLFYGRFNEQNSKPWDYAIYFNRFLDREQIENGYFPGGRVIHAVEADGVPLCVVLKNDTDRVGQRGYAAIQAQQPQQAVPLLQQAVQRYPKDQESWSQLALACAMSGDVQGFNYAATQALNISSIDQNTASMLSNIAQQLKQEQLLQRINSAMAEEYPDAGAGE